MTESLRNNCYCCFPPLVDSHFPDIQINLVQGKCSFLWAKTTLKLFLWLSFRNWKEEHIVSSTVDSDSRQGKPERFYDSGKESSQRGPGCFSSIFPFYILWISSWLFKKKFLNLPFHISRLFFLVPAPSPPGYFSAFSCFSTSAGPYFCLGFSHILRSSWAESQ